MAGLDPDICRDRYIDASQAGELVDFDPVGPGVAPVILSSDGQPQIYQKDAQPAPELWAISGVWDTRFPSRRAVLGLKVGYVDSDGNLQMDEP